MKTTIFYLRQLLVLFAVMLAFSACDDDKDDATGGDITIITPSNNAITCGGTVKDPFTISFTATGDWTARPSHGWLSLSKMTGGAGDHTIILMVSDNDNFDKSRVGTITITDKVSKKSVDILVTQGAKNAELTFSSESQDGMELVIFSDLKDPANNKIEGSVDVASNYDYEIKLDKEWLGYQTSRNDDGSTNINFKVTDYDKLYNDGGYGESTCTVSFVYASQTRAANTVTYKVKFPGITPYVEFYVSNEEEAEAVSSIELEEGDYIYKENEDDTEFITIHTYLKSAVYIKSNIAWENVKSDKFLFELNSAKNNSSTFFDSNTSVKVVLKEMTLDDIDDNISFTDIKNSQEVFGALNVKVQGLGNDYVFLDWSVFQPVDQITNHFMFEGAGASLWEPIEKEFVVKTTNPGKEKVFALNVFADSHYDIHEGVMESKADWVKLFEPLDYVGTTLKEGMWMVKVGDRGDDSDLDQKAPRYFALVAAPSTVNSFEELFEGGYLKEEFEKNCIILGQKVKVEELTFETGDVELDGTIEVAPEGELITINFTTNAPYGITTFIQNVKGSVDSPYDWSEDELDTSIFPKLDFPEDAIEITVAPNTTGKKREIRCGLAAYIPDSEEEKDYLLYTFTIVQEPAK